MTDATQGYKIGGTGRAVPSRCRRFLQDNFTRAIVFMLNAVGATSTGRRVWFVFSRFPVSGAPPAFAIHYRSDYCVFAAGMALEVEDRISPNHWVPVFRIEDQAGHVFDQATSVPSTLHQQLDPSRAAVNGKQDAAEVVFFSEEDRNVCNVGAVYCAGFLPRSRFFQPASERS